ncbi:MULTISPECIES: hypothetical protein [Rossellomorea]|uniref:DUF3899 domain-containing protein n=1 Tax=Rossellomorea aquimaris TaxID=189382 RepID=A0A5D4TSW7_9BACI|nr:MULTISPECIES: hypothetical protein [Rossellomorea]MDT9024153.1 hypothetical protein [Rossellomorea sp. YC4-1]TYS78980.1 hypothetical protein FZD05_10670 [Rossellomorea aquimaris]TYS84725.1 hypothetical protein FZC85_15300 [Rossellomorea aquimaris]
MNYYVNLLITIIILIIGTGTAFFIDQFSKQLEKFISSRYLSFTIIVILFTLMTGATVMTSSLVGWSIMDTAFISSLCFFALGWLTNISKRAGINQASTAAKFITNNHFKYEYESASSSNKSPYFIASLLFLVMSWGISFWMAYS